MSQSPTPSRPATGLGRGLSEIIAQGARSAAAPSAPLPDPSSVRQIPLSQIVANPKQPRLHFVEEPLDELVASIREHGVLQPITVRPNQNGFEIIAGERRFRACQKAGLATIPALVKTASDVEAYELALIENLQRENLDCIEEARGYRRLSEDFKLTQEQISQKVGKNRATVANAMRLLDLPEEVQGYLSQKRLSPGHAKAILSASSPDQQIRLAHHIIKLSLNVRQAEQLVSQNRAPRKKKSGSSAPGVSPHLQAIVNVLQQKLATRVQIHSVANGGRIEIQYYTPSDLDRILQMLQVEL